MIENLIWGFLPPVIVGIIATGVLQNRILNTLKELRDSMNKLRDTADRQSDTLAKIVLNIDRDREYFVQNENVHHRIIDTLSGTAKEQSEQASRSRQETIDALNKLSREQHDFSVEIRQFIRDELTKATKNGNGRH